MQAVDAAALTLQELFDQWYSAQSDLIMEFGGASRQESDDRLDAVARATAQALGLEF